MNGRERSAFEGFPGGLGVVRSWKRSGLLPRERVWFMVVCRGVVGLGKVGGRYGVEGGVHKGIGGGYGVCRNGVFLCLLETDGFSFSAGVGCMRRCVWLCSLPWFLVWRGVDDDACRVRLDRGHNWQSRGDEPERKTQNNRKKWVGGFDRLQWD